jgi:hypothetical protein
VPRGSIAGALTVPVTAVSIWSTREGRSAAISGGIRAVVGLVSDLLNAPRMRRRLPMVFLMLLLGGLGLRYGAQAIGLEARIAALANQPGVRTAFQHPESGRSDALTALIAVSVGTPMVLLAIVMLALLVVKMFEAVLVSAHMPAWLSLPLIGTSTVVAIYVTSAAWMPHSLHALGLVARAYLVFSYTSPPSAFQ